jgi:hypothetical protein
MFEDKLLKEKLKQAEKEFYGSANLGFFQQNGRLNKIASKNKVARKIPIAHYKRNGFTGVR